MKKKNKRQERTPSKKDRKIERKQLMTVGCAVIEKGGKVLIAQRYPGTYYGGYWEFPGGKRHGRESMEACLIRELREELGIDILPRKLLFSRRHEYPGRKVALFFVLSDWVGGTPVRRDCHDFKWVTPPEMRRYLFLPGDDRILTELIRKASYYFDRSGPVM